MGLGLYIAKIITKQIDCLLNDAALCAWEARYEYYVLCILSQRVIPWKFIDPANTWNCVLPMVEAEGMSQN